MEIQVRQDSTRHAGCDESSGWLWFAAEHLLQVLTSDSSIDLTSLRILEVGAGTGWLGLQLALRGANITVSDRKGAMPLLIRNVMNNVERLGDGVEWNIETLELDWECDTNLPEKHDLIIGSDVLYLVEHYQALLDTVIRHGCGRCILAWEERRRLEEQTFLPLAASMGFRVDNMEATINPTTKNPVWVISLTLEQ